MCRVRRALMLATALASAAFNAYAQDADVTAGHAFAREACRACHMVEPEESSPRTIAIGRRSVMSRTPAG
jgi:cytochrome c2